MVEKKFAVSELKIKYDGPLDIVEFFKVVEDWIEKKGLNKEIKKKSQEVTAKRKRLSWMIEIWEMPSDYAKRVVRLQALFNNIKDAKIKGKNVDTADVLIILDGILETDLDYRWHQKPTHYFLRAVYDKFFSKFYTHRFEGKLTADTYELYHCIMDYFNKGVDVKSRKIA
jgi:hypothetical protein